jgi:hypothetical protein
MVPYFRAGPVLPVSRRGLVDDLLRIGQFADRGVENAVAVADDSRGGFGAASALASERNRHLGYADALGELRLASVNGDGSFDKRRGHWI